jgi:hypothetical protein
MTNSTTTGSAVLDAMLAAGFRLSEDATYSGKDDKVSLSRVKVGGTLAAGSILDSASIVRAVAAGDGGQLQANGISSKVDTVSATAGVNVLLGFPLRTEDAIDAAASMLTRETVRAAISESNRRQDALRDAVLSESAKRVADQQAEDSHMGDDASVESDEIDAIRV